MAPGNSIEKDLCGFIYTDAQRLEEANVIGVDRELGLSILPAHAHQFWRDGCRFFITPVEPDGGFQHQKDVESFLFDPGDDLRYLLRF